jgi:hypothetical protein
VGARYHGISVHNRVATRLRDDTACRTHVGRLGDQTWDAPVLGPGCRIEVDGPTMEAVVAALHSSRRPVEIGRARIDRQIREFALEHAAGSLGDEAYLARLRALREQRDAIVERSAPGLPGHRAVEWLRALGDSIQTADVPKEKADLMHSIYDRIVVRGPEFVGARLTPEAYSLGLALALPEKVVLARPTGVKPTRTHSGLKSIPIEGAHDWEVATMSSA